MDWTEGYVDVGYTHDFYRELTPALHRFALLSRGIDAGGDLDKIRYCELGCGHGFSSVLLAAAHPDGEFHANDFLPGHIAYARKLAEDTGTTNITLYDDAFDAFGQRDLPDFDIIALHGVYTWVSEENRRHIVDFIARRLKVGGIVYISYNCHPGWATVRPLRDLMIMFSGNPTDPVLPRIDQALAKIQLLFDTNSMYTRLNPMLKDRFDSIRKQARSYVAHEYFNRDWTIFYHSDVARELRDAKLDFATTVQLFDHLDNFNLTPEQQKLLSETGNIDHREVLRDFIMNRQFRRDLYAKGGLPLSADDRNARIAAMRFVLTTLPADISRNVLTTLGSLGLNAAVFDPVIAAFAKGPRTIADVMDADETRALGLPVILEAVIILVGNNHMQPCLPAAGDAARAERTAVFNTAILERALNSNDLLFLASPLTGGGFQLNRFDQMFLLAQQRNHKDPAAFVCDRLIARNEGMVRDGKALRTAEENLAYLRERYADFQRRLPILQQLGIA
ncbi:MAG: class I SAM-dependent methyltransferase [Ferrovibrio sp.]|uniref:methyltransferase regulatory domain-containing protein n=1 Tax=Ferrovibrio sp. TaxID=1917215 RepID=UPI0026285E6B|nr:class I SAM-dependent methyltransferase [Ferrovibrio sp.]MCW0231977.1 class I SAM-dependent methyltransferase [Ferrovibrio sp.]